MSANARPGKKPAPQTGRYSEHVRSARDQEELLHDTKLGGTALAGEHILGAGLSVLYPPYSIRRGDSDMHVLLLTRAGEGILEIGNARHRLTGGTLCLLPAGSSYHYWTDKSWVKSWVHLAPVDRWSSLVPEFRLSPGSGWEDISALMRAFLNHRALLETGTSHILNAFTHSLVLLIERELAAGKPSMGGDQRRLVEDMRRRLYLDPARDWSVEMLAAEFGFSVRSLQRLVNRLYGFGTMEMVTRIRLEVAASLLRSSDRKLEDIATRVGYQNGFAFARVFKRHHGMSPGLFRQKGGPANAPGIPGPAIDGS